MSLERVLVLIILVALAVWLISVLFGAGDAAAVLRGT
jgi:hypothetical protein